MKREPFVAWWLCWCCRARIPQPGAGQMVVETCPNGCAYGSPCQVHAAAGEGR
jgi:hypothetical protein